jgi:hypothetical protein
MFGYTGISAGLYFYIIPAGIMIGCLCHMTKKLHKRVTQIHATPASSTVSTAKAAITAPFRRAKINIIKTLILFFATIVICWTDNIALSLIMFFDLSATYIYSTWIYQVSAILILMSCSINPLIYAVHYKKFKDAFKRCPCWKTSHGTIHTSHDNSNRSKLTRDTVDAII